MQAFTVPRVPARIAFLRVRILAAVSIGLVSATSFAAGEKPAGPVADKEAWPVFRGDPAMRGLSPVELPAPLELAWIHEAPVGERVEVTAPPIIVGDRVFVGDTHGTFRAIDLESGELAWSHEAEAKFEGAAVAADEGRAVVAGCGDGFIYAWNADDGEVLWKTETLGEVLAGANLWRDPETGKERILIGGYDYFLYCLDAANGEVIWKVESNNYINGAAAVSAELIYFGGCDGILYVVDVRSGELLQEIEIGAYIANSVVIDGDQIITAHYGNRVEARSRADGEQQWEYGPREFPFFASPAVTADSVIAGGRDNRLHRIDRESGEGIWEFRARRSIDSSPVITADGTIYFGSDDGYLYGVDYRTGEETWSHEIGNDIKSSPAIVDGWLVIGAGDGGVHAFRRAE